MKAPERITREEWESTWGKCPTRADLIRTCAVWSEASQTYNVQHRVCCYTCKHVFTPEELHEAVLERDASDWRKRYPTYWLVCAECPIPLIREAIVS